MKERKQLRGILGRLLLVVLCVHGVGQWTQAQTVRVYQPDAYPLLFLPEVRAAYASGRLIDAQANWIRAQGDYQVSLSKARQMNATAASMEMDNAIKWVETYFRRKEINREYRRKLNPTYLQRVQKANRLKHLILADDPSFVFQGDVTDELNWMLERLATTALMQSLFLQEEAPQGGGDLDKPLDGETLKHLNFSKGEKIGGKELVFRASLGTPFKFEWPLVLLGEEFKQERARFEKARDDLVAEVRALIAGKDSAEELPLVAGARVKSWEYLQFSVDKLTQRLLEVYPWERRREPSEYFAYMRGKRFLQSQAAGIVHAMTTNNVGLIAGDDKFEGKTIHGLLHHMCRRGLKFAEPLEGDQVAYRQVFLLMREIYLHYQPDAGGLDIDPRVDSGAENAGGDRLFGR